MISSKTYNLWLHIYLYHSQYLIATMDAYDSNGSYIGDISNKAPYSINRCDNYLKNKQAK